ncbi:MAG: hypothetical protein K0Q79_3615 [Flavipsychrobacter sp.]|jgi:hypothetical protein|nr:hypothetical protein [Flavipsychrobacter sp.]
MNYKHEVFISYKWDESERQKWVQEIFFPMVYDALYEGLAIDKAQVFHDLTNVPTGASIEFSLKDGLAHSKCMICILSVPYFLKSDWCAKEFSAMLKRETELEIKKKNNHTGLIFPVLFVYDEEKEREKRSNLYTYEGLKDLVLNMYPLELDWKYNSNSKAFKNTKNGKALFMKIKKWVDFSIIPTLRNKEFPKWQSQWYDDQYFEDAYKKFISDYKLGRNPPPPPLPQLV